MAPDKIELELKKMRQTMTWFVGITIPILILIIGGWGRAEVRITNTSEIVQKINDDYTPLFVMEGITGSTDKLINILNILPTTTKEDPRYIEAIRDREEFNREILTTAARTRGGGE
jgi:hypothetical protein